jgi:hypothetical protein
MKWLKPRFESWKGDAMHFSESVLLCFCVVWLAAGDAIAQQSGFLEDYSILRPRDPDKPGEPDLIYIKYQDDHAKWASYKQIILDPVQVWKGKDTDLRREHAEYLAKYLWSRLDEELSKDYTMTTQPGPGVLRIQIAITNDNENTQMGDIKTALPSGTRLIYEKHNWASSTEAFVDDREVAAEAKAIDSETGELLAAGVDKRSGGKYADKQATNWADVAEIGTFWAKRIRWRLCMVRGATDCERP